MREAIDGASAARAALPAVTAVRMRSPRTARMTACRPVGRSAVGSMDAEWAVADCHCGQCGQCGLWRHWRGSPFLCCVTVRLQPLLLR